MSRSRSSRLCLQGLENRPRVSRPASRPNLDGLGLGLGGPGLDYNPDGHLNLVFDTASTDTEYKTVGMSS